MIQHKQIDTVFVLTDNKEYCKQIFNGYSNIKFIYSNERDFMDLWIMSLVKNNIVSASTMAWWGSYLNTNIDRYVICCKGNRNYKEWTVI